MLSLSQLYTGSTQRGACYISCCIRAHKASKARQVLTSTTLRVDNETNKTIYTINYLQYIVMHTTTKGDKI